MRYPEGMARRGVHPKDHGCVKATFTINPDIPEKYRVGVFATPARQYPAWIPLLHRDAFFSRRSWQRRSRQSRHGDQLMGVEGDTLLNEPGAKTQDFLLINLPAFAFPNVSDYLEVTKIQLANHDNITPFFAPPVSPERMKTLAVVKKIKQTMSAIHLIVLISRAVPRWAGYGRKIQRRAEEPGKILPYPNIRA